MKPITTILSILVPYPVRTQTPETIAKLPKDALRLGPCRSSVAVPRYGTVLRRLSTLAICLLIPVATLAHPLPGFPEFGDIDVPEDTTPKRIAFLKLALESAAKFKLNQYIYGSADPERGGFDCSGSVFYLLGKSDIDPPRSSAAQFDWIKKAGNLIEIPDGTSSLDSEVFAKLKPGDLLFWSGTYSPTDGRTNKITHVQIYLGREKKDGRHVMIGSTDGRSYRGSARTGFGVYDFKLPRPTSKSRFAGYGSPPPFVEK